MSVGAQQILIGPTTRNGSFEDVVTAPWGLIDSVIQDPSFASHGSWYASASAVGTPNGLARTASYQVSLPAYPANGLEFLLRFDARVGTSGFTALSCALNANNTDGMSQPFVRTPIATPPLSTVSWNTFVYEFRLPPTWDGGGGNQLTIGFQSFSAQPGTTYYGFLDNVVLEQIPEPSFLALAGLTTLCFSLRVLRGHAPFGKLYPS